MHNIIKVTDNGCSENLVISTSPGSPMLQPVTGGVSKLHVAIRAVESFPDLSIQVYGAVSEVAT